MAIGNYSCQFNICCPRDCVSRHNGGTEVPPLCRETQSLGQQMLNWQLLLPMAINGVAITEASEKIYIKKTSYYVPENSKK